MSVSACMTLANVLTLAAVVCYYIHAYWYNTMDFLHYRTRLAFPAANFFMKYLYANSFVLFVTCAIFFIVGTAISIGEFANPTFAWCWLGLSLLLLLGAVRLLMLKSIAQWPRRAE